MKTTQMTQRNLISQIHSWQRRQKFVMISTSAQFVIVALRGVDSQGWGLNLGRLLIMRRTQINILKNETEQRITTQTAE